MTMTAERARAGSRPEAETSTMSVGEFLLRRLREAGVEHAFGVPGDYNLELLQQMEDTGTLEWIGACNELNASYAADGYARLNGLSALIVTNAVGALSAINGIAGSYSEHVPVICICGSIPLKSIERGRGMHHTMADGTWDRFIDAFARVTAAQARITPHNAVSEIDRLVTTAWHDKLPVYMELPSDIAYLDIEVPTAPLMLAEPPSDAERLRSCAAAITSRLARATSPAILVDSDVDRFGAAAEVMGLAEKIQAPVAVISTAKAAIDETFHQYIGLYNGKASQPGVQEAIEHSDCLLSIGYRMIDLTSGDFTASLPASTINLRGHSVDVGEDNYQAVTLKEVLRGVIDTVPQVTNRGTRRFPAAAAAMMGNGHADGSAKLTQAAYWQAIQGYIRSGDVLIAEDGTSYASFGLQLPPNCSFVSQPIWGSIGYTVPSLLGTLTAAPDRRHLLFVGDGSFQLTAQEVSTMLRHDYKPVIFLINNGGYTIERCWLGKTSRFNDVADWSYADLPKVFQKNTTARSFVVKTIADLEKALSAPNDRMIFIESVMDPFDAPVPVINSGNSGADIDYGPRGPQHRGNMLIRPS